MTKQPSIVGRFLTASIAIPAVSVPVFAWSRQSGDPIPAILVAVVAWLVLSVWILRGAASRIGKARPIPAMAIIVVPLSLAFTALVAGFIGALFLYRILGLH